MWIAFIVAALVLFLDQLSKLIIEITYLFQETHFVIPNFFYITKTYNTGAAWSFFSDNTVILCVISIVASVVVGLIIVNTVKSFKKMKLYAISLGMILGGAVGNLVDRFLTSINQRKGVIDMLGFNFGSYSFPVFNLADSFLVIGVILLIIDMLFFMDKRKDEKNDI